MQIYTPLEIFSRVEDFFAKNPQGVLEILGPTASGKTDFALEVAQKYAPAEIISVDSRQIFKGFSLSSAKITSEEQKGIPHFGLDVVSPEEDYSVADFQAYAFEKIREIHSRRHRAIMCGGTMLWLDAVSENYLFSPDKNQKSNQKDTPLWPFLKIGIHWDRTVLYERCNKRALWQFEGGLIEEVKNVTQKYPRMTRSARTNFGYKEVQDYLEGKLSYEQALELNQKRNRNYAKRQLTWWRGREDVLWVEGALLV